jgi:cytochrome c oxidase assembly factor CtaG
VACSVRGTLFDMTNILLTGWTFYPSVLIGFGLWTTVYILITGVFRIRNVWGKSPTSLQQVAFHIGTLVGLITLISPLDELGDEYLFSAHMVQHLLLMFVTAPLWLVGIPGWLVDLIIPIRPRKFVKWLTRSGSAYAVFVSVMTIWHVPALYTLALNNDGIHIFEHLTFIGAALIGWWPVLVAQNSVASPLSPPARLLYLFLLAIPMTALAAILTFSSTPLYSFYVQAPHTFGFGVMDDQRLGGLLMWLPTHMVLLLIASVTFQKWFTEEDRQAKALYLSSR